MKHTHILSIISFFLTLSSSYGQLEVGLSIENQSISGTDYTFDIYLRRVSPESEGNLFLGNADLIIAFNTNMFNSPSLEKMGINPTGYCNFQPSTPSTINNLVTQSFYFDNTDITIEGNYLIINLNGPTPGDTSTFNNRVANIDDQSLTHRFGRFKITGVSNPSAQANLQWKTIGTGLKTKLFSLSSNSPFNSFQVDLQTDSNTCPDNLVLDEPLIPGGNYQAAITLMVTGQIDNSANLTLRAGQSIELNPQFALEAGSTMEVSIGGCQ